MKIKKYIIGAALLLFIICTFFIQFHSDLLFLTSFKVSYSDVVSATMDREGKRIVIDLAGQRLVKEDPETGVVFAVKHDAFRGKGLDNAVKVITDKENHIYVLNIIKEEGGYRIRKEEILEYSPEGKYIGIVYQIKHDTPVLVKDITGLYLYDGGLAYIIDKTDSFSVYNRDNQLICHIDCKGIKDLAVSYAIEPGTHDIYYSTKQGEIIKISRTGEYETVYDCGSYPYLSVPRDISFDQDGNLYFTDIGLRTVSKLDPDGNLTQILQEGELGKNLSSKQIYYYLDAGNGLVAVTADYAVSVNDGISNVHSGSAFSLKNCFFIISVWVGAVYSALVVLYLLYLLAVIIIKKSSRTFRIAVGVVAGAVFVAGVFIMIVIPDFEDRLLNSVLQRAQVVSDVIEINLPVENYRNIDNPKDYLGTDYLTVRNSINKIFQSGSEEIKDFYCVLYTIRDDALIGSYSLQEYSGCVYPYFFQYEGSDEQWIMENGKGKEYKSISTSEGNYLFVLNPLFDAQHQAVGMVEVGTDLNSFHKETKRLILEILLNVFIITVVVIMAAIEGVIFLQGRSRYLENKKNITSGSTNKLPDELLRILVFAVFLVTNMTTSFLPVHAMDIAGKSESFKIPKEILAAIPISAEVICGAVFSIAGSYILRRIGIKKSAVFGSLLFTGGLLVRFILPDIWILTLGNGIMGCGWGLLLLMVNTSIAMGGEEEKNKGFSGYTSAALKGVNCGIVFGGFLTNWLSHSAIFMSAAVLSLPVAAHSVLYLSKISGVNMQARDKAAAPSMSFRSFITDRKVLGFFVFITIPVIACGYFLNYLFPLLGTEYGLSETKIGYAYIINGLCVICFSSILTVYFSRKIKKANSLIFASLLYAAAFICVAVFQNILSLIIVLILLGLSDSFGLPLQTSYYTDLEAVKSYGYDKSIGIFSLVENAAQAGGSFIFSYVLLIGVKEGLILVVCIVAAMAILFGFFSRKRLINRSNTAAVE